VRIFLPHSLCSYRESSPEQLAKFEAEIAKDGKLENKAMATIMQELAKPNPEKKNTEAKDVESKVGFRSVLLEAVAYPVL
jgi:hypothetical protein